MIPGVFISYRRRDQKWAVLAAREEIEKRLPSVPVFLDIDSIQPGENFEGRILDSIDRCSVLLAMIGPTWTKAESELSPAAGAQTDWVEIELKHALSRGIPIIPVLMDDTSMPRRSELPDTLKDVASLSSAHVAFHSRARDISNLVDAVCSFVPVRPLRQPEREACGNDLHTLDVEQVASLLDEAGADPLTVFVMAQSRLERGEAVLAEALFAAVHARWARELTPPNRHPDTLNAQVERGRALAAQGRYADAEKVLRKALPVRQAVFGADSDEVLRTRQVLATTLRDQGYYDDAASEFKQIADARLPSDSRVHELYVTALRNYASTLVDLGQPKAALSTLDSLVTQLTNDPAFGATHEQTLAVRIDRAVGLLNEGAASEAEKELRELVPIAEEVLGEWNPNTLSTIHNHASALIDSGRIEQGAALFAELIPKREELLGRDNPEVLFSRHNYASALLSLGDARKAEIEFRELLEDRVKIFTDQHPHVQITLALIALACLEQGKPWAAKVSMDSIANNVHDIFDKGHPFLGRLDYVRGRMAAAEGDRDTAAQFFDNAARQWGSALAPQHYYWHELEKARIALDD